MAKSIAESAGALPLALLEAGASDATWEELRWDWRFWARPEQQMPVDPWTYWLVLAGRGWGKTRVGAEAVRAVVASGEVQHVGLVAKTPADARDVMIEGPAGILACTPPAERPTWEPSKRRLTWPNGVVGLVFSGEAPDQLRGPQHQLVWCDELCAFQFPQDTWDNLALGLRIPWRSGGPARAIVTTTPRPTKTLRDLMTLRDCVTTRGKTTDNRGNLDANFLQQMLDRYTGTRLGRQELDAEILDDTEGALWTRATLDATRVRDYPQMRRLVVAVDPAVSAGADSDETGIVVFGAEGLAVEDNGYVLEDLSARLHPRAWAEVVVEAFHRWEADEVVAEVNNGGDLVEANIHAVDPSIRVRKVRASRGKRTRAEPIATLYERGRIHHVGGFAKLEDQMTTYSGARTDRSPDRLDALVWGAAATMLSEEAQAAHGFS
jgi:phage terminase large subunit-like protein